MSQTYPERSEVKVCDPVLSANDAFVFSDVRAGYNGILATGNRSLCSRTVAGQNDNVKFKIAVFLHGTTIMHKNAIGRSREERVAQSKAKEESVLDYASYVPIGNAIDKLRHWVRQGAEIYYLSSHESESDVKKDKEVLMQYDFPSGEILFRTLGESYADVVERIVPNILIEDDCESIGGREEMVSTHLRPRYKTKIKLIVVKEFEGVDQLPDDLETLASMSNFEF